MTFFAVITLQTDFLDKFGFTITYSKKIIQWVDHEIPLKDPNKLFDTNMVTDLNDTPCLGKEDDIFD